ncbi:MAG: hypothetical protein WDN26_04235 [Chitinophagaceae bacterium]
MIQTLQTKIETKSLSVVDYGKSSILKTLAYFDIFNYPLIKEEIQQFLETSIPQNKLETLLQQLVSDRIIFLHNSFYSLQNNPLLGHRRKQGNKRAQHLLLKAAKIGRFLYGFPFVRAVGISGSLSKNFADEKADIDFFIITKKNRLWMARTLMHLFKKITFLFGKQHFYCMNYYIDEECLLIKDKNIFTATEIKTLLPVNGSQTLLDFLEANSWADDWLPCCDARQQKKKDPKTMWLKKIIEWIAENKLSNRLDNYLMQLTSLRWKRKEEKGLRNKKGLTMGLITGKHFAFSNPGAFQEKVLSIYEEKLTVLKLS